MTTLPFKYGYGVIKFCFHDKSLNHVKSAVYSVCLSVVLVGFVLVDAILMATLLGKS